MTEAREQLILLTGGTGYIGGRLLSLLAKDGLKVRALARHPENIETQGSPQTEAVAGDLLDRPSLANAMEGVATAFYLVHSMAATQDFEQRDREAAMNFATAAREAGVRRIVYLGGLGRGDLSPHLASRQEVGEILRSSGVPTVEFRASVVIGSGSLSFEMIRALVDRLPVMITPRWVRTRTQPIAIEDLLAYLRAAIDLRTGESAIIEIGGADATSYGDLMIEYAHQRGLRRWMIPVPVLSPHLSSLWLGLVTPLYARVGRQLVESMRHETVLVDDRAQKLFDIKPMDFKRAIERALRNEDFEFAATRWSDALSSGDTRGFGGETYGSRIIDSRFIEVGCPPAQAFAAVEALGGQTGWHAGTTLWRLRGFVDLLVGGPGLRRGRRNPRYLAVGQTLDFWRVEGLERGKLLRLRAEMRLPGRAWLQFEVEDAGEGCSIIRQTALFDPVGVAGLAYWYVLFPIHSYVFKELLDGIGRAAVTMTVQSGARTGA